ncbi:MAG: DnaJ domain-containing protein [Blastocatellia bacterium]
MNGIEDRSLTPDEIGLLAGLIIDEPDHYTVLGVDRNASIKEIQAAYCLAVESFHPVKRREITETDSVMHWRLSSAFIRIEEAFSVLSRSSRRKIYDNNLSQSTEPSITGARDRNTRAAGTQTGRRRAHQDSEPEARFSSNTPNGQDGDGRGFNKRRAVRTPLKLPLRVTFDRHWQELTETLDVSPLGVRFRLSRRIEPGSLIRLEMPLPKHMRTDSYGDEPYVVSAFVVYISRHKNGREVVAEFI